MRVSNIKANKFALCQFCYFVLRMNFYIFYCLLCEAAGSSIRTCTSDV